MFKLRLSKRGQSIFEYAIILGIVGVALSAMQVYLRRGIQCGIRVAADQLASQEGSVDREDEIGRDASKTLLQQQTTQTTSNATHTIQQGDNALFGVYGVSENVTTTVLHPQPNESYSGWLER